MWNQLLEKAHWDTATVLSCRQTEGGNAAVRWLEQLTAPLRLGGDEMLPTVAKLTSAVTVRTLGANTLRQLGGQVLLQHARYEAALALLCSGGARGVSAGVGRQAAVQVGELLEWRLRCCGGAEKMLRLEAYFSKPGSCTGCHNS